MDIEVFRTRMDENNIKRHHFIHRGVHVTFSGCSPFDLDELISWSFTIDHGDHKHIDIAFLNDVKDAASSLGPFVQVEISKQFGKPIEDLLVSEGFEHWFDEDDVEDNGYWWPRY
jgi:hypothetical protein